MNEIIDLLQQAKQMLEETQNDNLKSNDDGWNIVADEELWWKAELSANLLGTIIESLSEIR